MCVAETYITGYKDKLFGKLQYGPTRQCRI